MRTIIKIGTRKSALALWQAEYVGSELKRLYPHITVELVHFDTKGDQILEKPLAEIGGKGLFTAELEAAMRAALCGNEFDVLVAEFTARLLARVITGDDGQMGKW